MLGVQWSHIFTWDLELNGVTYKLAGTHGPNILTGDTGTPKDRFQATIQWAKGPWTITGTGNYVGSYDLTDPSAGVNNCEDGVNSYAGHPRYGRASALASSARSTRSGTRTSISSTRSTSS